MSILSTNTKLIKVGQEYSAGSGIRIDNYVISVSGDVGGKTYSAGDNIGIYTQDNQLYISGKDWQQDIANASANAYNAATAQIPAPQDLSYLSGRIDTNTSGIDYISSVCITANKDWTDTIKGASSYSYEQSTSYFDKWISGQYTGDITSITNKITALSGDFDNYYKKNETSSKDEINDALQYVSANAGKVYEGVSPIVVNNVEDKISADTWTFSAGSNVSFVDDNLNKITRIDCTITGQGGDEEVNSFVYNNSATIVDVDNSYKANSGTFLTAAPSNMATTGDVAELAQTISETYQVKGDYLVRSDSANFYPSNNPSGFVTGVDLSNYYTKYETSGKEELANAFANIPAGDTEVNTYVQNNSATINEVNTTYQSNSSNYITAHQSLDGYATTSWVNQQGYVTKVSIPESATWNEVTTAVQINSAQWADVGPITSYTKTLSDLGCGVINTLNDTFISAFLSQSADNSNFANNANSANSANYAETVNETYLENKGFARNLTSEYGTVSIIHNNIIESTNSAIVRTCNEGFVSSFEGQSIGPEVDGVANYIWDKALPNTIINLDMGWSNKQILTYSANTDLTGEIVLPIGTNTQTINIPNATEFKVWANNWIHLNSAVVSAADQFETVVGELALTSALPTYEYDSTNKISAINGSAIGGGEGGNVEVNDYVQNNSATINEVNTTYQANSGLYLTAHQDISNKVDLSSYNELKQSYDALSSLFATYSGQWLLPNEGV